MKKSISPQVLRNAPPATQTLPLKASKTSLGSGKVLVKKFVEKLVKTQVVISGFKGISASLVRRTLESYLGLPKRLSGPAVYLQLVIRLASNAIREWLALWVAHGPRQGGSRRFRLFTFKLTG